MIKSNPFILRGEAEPLLPPNPIKLGLFVKDATSRSGILIPIAMTYQQHYIFKPLEFYLFNVLHVTVFLFKVFIFSLA